MSFTGSPLLQAFHNMKSKSTIIQRRSDTLDNTSVSQSQSTFPNFTGIVPSFSDPPQLHGATVLKPKRQLQNVLPISHRIKIVKWVIDEVSDCNTEKHIASKAVKHFPLLFKGKEKANNIKAVRLWKARSSYIKSDNGENKTFATCITRPSSSGLKRILCKARSGRGRKQSDWAKNLYADLLVEFDRLRKAGMKMSGSVLREIAVNLIQSGSSEMYNSNTRDPKSHKPITVLITSRWIQSFMNRNEIVSRKQTGKLMVSVEKQTMIEKEVAFHLGKLKREFDENLIDENDVGNADETHFLVNMDNHRTLGKVGDQHVKYADVVSGSEGMTMMVRLSGGRDAKIESPFLVFQNKQRNYPIARVPDDVAGVSYRSGPKGWIDGTVFPQYFEERKVISSLPSNRQRILFVDNCSGHNMNQALDQALSKIKTEIRLLPANSTHLTQPADSFIIQKLKDCWRRKWESLKMDAIMKREFSKDSGKIPNPGKHFLLKLAASVVREVNGMRDENGLSYARKAMIMCGLSLNLNGRWEEGQLSPELQRIVSKHRKYFDGEPVVDGLHEDV